MQRCEVKIEPHAPGARVALLSKDVSVAEMMAHEQAKGRTWSDFTKDKAFLEGYGQRLENYSWRMWSLSRKRTDFSLHREHLFDHPRNRYGDWESPLPQHRHRLYLISQQPFLPAITTTTATSTATATATPAASKDSPSKMTPAAFTTSPIAAPDSDHPHQSPTHTPAPAVSSSSSSSSSPSLVRGVSPGQFPSSLGERAKNKLSRLMGTAARSRNANFTAAKPGEAASASSSGTRL